MVEIIVKEYDHLLFPVLWTGKEAELAFTISLVGRGAKITFLVLLLGKNNQSLQLKTTVYHKAKDTSSDIIVKGTLTDTASVNFEGLVKIEKGAKGTKAWLAAHILLLSKKARGRAIPSLEILENDIKAGHATTVGHIDNVQLFYLMSRGLSEITAKKLLIEGFLYNLLAQFPEKKRKQGEKELAIYAKE
jgi:Fe-S cluster assembly protein SufD